MQTLARLINYIFDAYIFMLLLRFLLQKLQASWHNPVTKFVVNLTDPPVKIVRRVIPGYRGFDFSIIVMAFLLEIVQLYLVNWMRLGFTLGFSGVLIIALSALLTKFAYLFIFSIMIWALLSWFSAAQQNPISEITGIVAYPLLRLARRFVPLLSGVDISPIVVIIVLYLVMAFVLNPLWSVGLNVALG